MHTYQYKVERFDLMHSGSYHTLENMLNERGKDGWEFDSVQMIPVGGQAAELPFAIFKRQS
jgi:hypothetical protein